MIYWFLRVFTICIESRLATEQFNLEMDDCWIHLEYHFVLYPQNKFQFFRLSKKKKAENLVLEQMFVWWISQYIFDFFIFIEKTILKRITPPPPSCQEKTGWSTVSSWIPCKLVIPSRFILWKKWFSDISRKCILPNMIRKG